jgi:hypothetical protein
MKTGLGGPGPGLHQPHLVRVMPEWCRTLLGRAEAMDVAANAGVGMNCCVIKVN